jgi:hypothetical protein
VTTLEKKQVFELTNFNLQCGEKSYSENIIISRDGATIEIPLKHISIMRSLQQKNGFFIETEDGKKLTGNKITCKNYQWVGTNQYGARPLLLGTNGISFSFSTITKTRRHRVLLDNRLHCV